MQPYLPHFSSSPHPTSHHHTTPTSFTTPHLITTLPPPPSPPLFSSPHYPHPTHHPIFSSPPLLSPSHPHPLTKPLCAAMRHQCCRRHACVPPNIISPGNAGRQCALSYNFPVCSAQTVTTDVLINAFMAVFWKAVDYLPAETRHK